MINKELSDSLVQHGLDIKDKWAWACRCGIYINSIDRGIEEISCRQCKNEYTLIQLDYESNQSI